jgi:hypothetical protein
VRFTQVFGGAHPSFATAVEVAARAGCDLQPLDPCSDEGRATLRAYVWPDQGARLQRLNGALEVAASVPLEVERMTAGDFLARELGALAEGQATVIFHSIMMQYVPKAERTRISDILHDAGARADAEAPAAWLRFEPAKDGAGGWIHRLALTLWPPGDEEALATASPHGPPVEWTCISHFPARRA